MKSNTRILSFAMAAVLVFLVVGCSSQSDVQEQSKSSSSEQSNQQSGSQIGTWTIGTPVDDFGDAVEDGESFVQQLFIGEFSNTATSKSDLGGAVAIQWQKNSGQYAVLFNLLEYLDHRATYSSSDSLTLKTKNSSGNTKEYTLIGTPPNGSLFLIGDAFLQDLANESEAMKCVVEIGSSKYSFTIQKANFMDVMGEYETKVQNEIDQHNKDVAEYKETLKSNDASEAIEKITPENPYEARYNAKAYFRDHASEYMKLGQSEIEALFPNRYAKFSLKDSSGGGAIYYYENGMRNQEVLWNKDQKKDTSNEGIIDVYSVEDGKLLNKGRAGNKVYNSYQISMIADGYYVFLDEDGNPIELAFECDMNGVPTKPLNK